MNVFHWHLQVRQRTAASGNSYGSHVMQYGDLQLSQEKLYEYMGSNPANENFTFTNDNSLLLGPSSKAVNQRDADLLHFWYKVCQNSCFLRATKFCSFFLIYWSYHCYESNTDLMKTNNPVDLWVVLEAENIGSQLCYRAV